MRASKVRVVPLDAILGVPPEQDALAITFDDGFANFAQSAWPLFKSEALPVTLFVATSRVGADNAWPDICKRCAEAVAEWRKNIGVETKR